MIRFVENNLFLLLNFIVWMDVRTEQTVDKVLGYGKRSKNYLKPLCGLPVSTYFSALKLRWLMDNVPEIQLAIKRKTCVFGTIDTWLIWVFIIIKWLH